MIVSLHNFLFHGLYPNAKTFKLNNNSEFSLKFYFFSVGIDEFL
jgi:hypothetical protein